jgi:putative addiction module killer protein
MPFLSVAGQVAMVQLVPSVNDRLQYCSCTVKRTPEMREHFGSGWRMYDLQCGAVLIVMLGGGDKRTQAKDIAAAKALAANLVE